MQKIDLKIKNVSYLITYQSARFWFKRWFIKDLLRNELSNKIVNEAYIY